MILLAIRGYINLGEILWYLRYAREGWKVHEDRGVLNFIDSIFTYLDEFNLPVTRRAGENLRNFQAKLIEAEAERKLTIAEANELKDVMIDLEKTLMAEASGNMAFIVTDKRIDVNKLLHNIPSLMAPEVFESLPEIAKYDFKEAGKCIAFETPTAGAFHLLRATEAVLREFYCLNVKRGRVELLWYHMVEDLRKRRKLIPRPLLDNLDNIRWNFRNPTQHPEKMYDIHEVQDLFGLCVDVINRMISFIKMSERKNK